MKDTFCPAPETARTAPGRAAPRQGGAVRVAAFDLDGTLLDSSKNLSPGNRAALARAAAAGVVIVPATGRFWNGIPDCVRSLPFVRYAITMNGAQVWDAAEARSVAKSEIPVALALEAMRFADGMDAIYDCYRDGKGWMTASMQARAEEFAPDEPYLRMIREMRSPVPDLKENVAAVGRDVQKLIVWARRGTSSSPLREAFAARFPGLCFSSSTPNNVEINLAGTDKGRALLQLCDHLGIDRGGCLAAGDGLNDLEMVRAAGIGVAMGNAVPEVLAAADWIAPSSDDDGIAAALARFVP